MSIMDSHHWKVDLQLILVDFHQSWSILVDLWPVDTKTGFERPCQSTLGSPIDFNGN